MPTSRFKGKSSCAVSQGLAAANNQHILVNLKYVNQPNTLAVLSYIPKHKYKCAVIYFCMFLMLPMKIISDEIKTCWAEM
jgi:hypothetical protein